MTDRQWSTIALLLERGFKWREPFGPAHERAYRTLLDGYDASQLAAAIRKLVAAGQVFGPAPGEIIAAHERDEYRPTFIEAYSMIFDSHPPRGGRGVLWTPGGDAARLDRAFELHPLLGAFVQSYGIDRLRMLEVDHEDHGALVRRDLQVSWDCFAEASEHRDAAALAAGRRRELTRGPQRFDPARALQGTSADEHGEE